MFDSITGPKSTSDPLGKAPPCDHRFIVIEWEHIVDIFTPHYSRATKLMCEKCGEKRDV